MRTQHEFPGSGQVFNLAGERGVDPDRVARELREAEQRRVAAAEYELRMQRKLSECPGVVGFDSPTSPDSLGKVVVEPAHVVEAAAWLKRRFVVSEDLELSGDTGLVFSIAPRKIRLHASGGKRIRVHFDKPTQFELPL